MIRVIVNEVPCYPRNAFDVTSDLPDPSDWTTRLIAEVISITTRYAIVHIWEQRRMTNEDDWTNAYRAGECDISRDMIGYDVLPGAVISNPNAFTNLLSGWNPKEMESI